MAYQGKSVRIQMVPWHKNKIFTISDNLSKVLNFFLNPYFSSVFLLFWFRGRNVFSHFLPNLLVLFWGLLVKPLVKFKSLPMGLSVRHPE